MKKQMFLTHILLIFQNVAVRLKGANSGVANKNETWFLYQKYLFYVQAEQKFSASEAEAYCAILDIQSHTIDNILHSDKFILFTILEEKYGPGASFWLKKDNNSTMVSESSKKCNAIHYGGKMYAADCMSLKGSICFQEIIGATLQYRNGSNLKVDADKAILFCNPSSNKYDDALQYCLIDLE